MAQTKVTNFGDWTLFIFSLLISCLATVLKYQNVVDFDISVNQATLMNVPEARQHVLCPDAEFFVFHRLVFAHYSSRKVIRSVASVLHIETVALFSLCVMKCLDDVWVIHLGMNRAFASGK